MSSPSYRFCLERSPTPIYQRLINGFMEALIGAGHQVKLLNSSDYSTESDYLNEINSGNFDFILITNLRAYICQYWETMAGYGFEFVNSKVIFIHHDSICIDFADAKEIGLILNAFVRHRERTHHFCLEYSNFLDLRSLGISNAYPIDHASEYSYSEQNDNYEYEVSFVGELLPSLGDELSQLPGSHRLRADMWRRIASLDANMEDSALDFVRRGAVDSNNSLDLLASKQYYLSLLHRHSFFMAGEIIQRLENTRIDIIGGDPNYLPGKTIERKIAKETIHYHPALSDPLKTAEVYRNSKINLNITGLQFDTAVINPVIDIAAVGGFVLTDWRSDLQKLTSVAKEISYRSIEELNEKLHYYLDPAHQSERLEIAKTLHQDVREKCSYPVIVEEILSKLNNTMSNFSGESLRVDLGCGPWKAEGFIGVDIVPGPCVDVVADLSKRFPFADNSVRMVKAFDVIEHLPDRLHTMNEIWRICEQDAIVDISVPSTDGRGAFQDPTHVSFWNHNSFKYYCVQFPNYWRLGLYYGFRGAFYLEKMEEYRSADEVIHVRAILKVMKSVEAIKELQTQSSRQIHLKGLNLLVCPDWFGDEEILNQQLSAFLEKVWSHPAKDKITLLITSEEVDKAAIEFLLADLTLSILEGVETNGSEQEPNLILVDSGEVSSLLKVAESITARILIGIDRPAPDGFNNIPILSLQDWPHDLEQFS
ncbi:MAG: hypothetical protein N5P05_000684 [Chroococcopsis gigantea SAG 12.99]|jgi:SAM-dependent methyltransferase|nr:glycosyltransferase [Chlorogloea purpurea SAG 13.99]MDV2999078.1 hypothetical protein [Chroococcopsis gigantea SAG 12.99]